MYNLMDDTNRDQKILYCNTCLLLFLFVLLFCVALMVGPLAKDGSILIDDASETLKDYGSLIPKINALIPETQNATRILGRMIPEIREGLYVLTQLCRNDPNCHF